jgi:hypothetical protein
MTGVEGRRSAVWQGVEGTRRVEGKSEAVGTRAVSGTREVEEGGQW